MNNLDPGEQQHYFHQATAIANLLNPDDKKEEPTGPPESFVKPAAGMTPSAGYVPKPAPLKVKEQLPGKDMASEAKGDIWEADDEIPVGPGFNPADGRAEPEYEFLYSQDVGSNDMFLGMAGKDPSSTSCERLLVKLHVSGEDPSDLDVEVEKSVLRMFGKKYRLVLSLPENVEDNKTTASWDAKREILTIATQVVREYAM